MHRSMQLMAVAGSLAALWLMAGALAAQAEEAKGEPYKIGVTYPLSGPQGAWGQLLVPAMELGAQDVNAAGGVNGRPLKLVVEDSKGNPEGAVTAMRKVVQVDGVAAILTIFTNVVSAQMPLADQLKVPILSPVEAPGLVKNSQWAFAYSSPANATLPLIFQYWKDHNVKRVFAFFPNTPIAKFLTPMVTDATKQMGIQYDEALFKLGDTDFRGLITRAKGFDPDAILIYGHGTPDEGVIMKQVRELGMTQQLYTGCACMTIKSYRDSAGDAAIGLIFAGFKYDRDHARKFIDAYHAKLGFDPDYGGLEVYDMLFMLADAIKKHGYSGDGIRQGLAELKDFHSIGGGVVTMDPDRQAQVSVALYKISEASKPDYAEIKP
jgi:branched-chain amino acid transport system substrate-binding protein